MTNPTPDEQRERCPDCTPEQWERCETWTCLCRVTETGVPLNEVRVVPASQVEELKAESNRLQVAAITADRRVEELKAERDEARADFEQANVERLENYDEARAAETRLKELEGALERIEARTMGSFKRTDDMLAALDAVNYAARSILSSQDASDE